MARLRMDLIREALDTLDRAISGAVPVEYVERVAALIEGHPGLMRPDSVLRLARINYRHECEVSALASLRLAMRDE